ncbi:MAG: 30S ribosome-binding factor RbfA [Rhodothermus sp.]|nr:30S ribosome-binding factor RbfA [Rhodothermus sp.]
MSSSIRVQRVGSLLKRELADILQHEFGDQLPPMTTVTDVQPTRDLSIAKVYVSIYAPAEQKQAAFRRLQELTPQIRTVLAQRIRHQMRFMPELRFILDETMERAQRVEELLARIREERARREGQTS